MSRWSPAALVCVIALAACGSDDGGGGGAGGTPAASVASRTSTLCTGITGMEALAWDYYNGVLVTDPILPPPVPVGGVYGNEAWPLLGFSYPAGWAPVELNAQNVLGVDLVRNDSLALWRYLVATVSGVFEDPANPNGLIEYARASRLNEQNALAQSLGYDPQQIQTICLNEAVAPQSGGINIYGSNALIRMGDHSAIVVMRVTPFPGLPNAQVYERVMTSPTAEFSDRLYDTFIAIEWQFLVGDSSNLTDRDGDGWRDGVDEFPDDPTRH